MLSQLQIDLDRHARLSLSAQIHHGVKQAIASGRLQAGMRLPSWRDLAAQLGVARGTVRAAYERLIDEQLVVSAGAAGSFVATPAPGTLPASTPAPAAEPPLLPAAMPIAPVGPAVFQLGVPAADAFPAKAWARIVVRNSRAAAALPVGYPHPSGEMALRHEIVASLAMARGIACTPAQVFITNGYAGALALVLRALATSGASCWMEEPGYPLARRALQLCGIRPVPVAVDEQGLNVAAGIAAAPQAQFALITAGQQAPLGCTLSLARRHALLDWANRQQAWIIEDDYLGELQLKGRAAPALASLDGNGRVLHIGTFSKTINPALRLGFLVVPPGLLARVGEYAHSLAAAPSPTLQLAVAEFLRDGHYLRHLRRMKRLYGQRRQKLADYLASIGVDHALAGLAIVQALPRAMDDREIVRRARLQGLSPVPLSPWYSQPEQARAGLLLGITNLAEAAVVDCHRRLSAVIEDYRREMEMVEKEEEA